MKDPLGRMLTKWRVEAVLPYVRGRLIDIGCGTNELVRRHGSGLGVDVHQWGTVDLLVENSANLPFDSASFDTVAIIAALNHIPNRLEVLREAHRLLRDDGIVIITMIDPCVSRIWHLCRRPWDMDQSERGMTAGEVFGLTGKEVLRLLGEADFEVILERKFMCRVNHITVARKKPATMG